MKKPPAGTGGGNERSRRSGLSSDLDLGLAGGLGGGLSRGGLAPPGGGHRQPGVMLPLTGPDLPAPALKRDRLDRRPVLVADHLAPGAGIRRAHLSRTASHAQQSLASRGQTGDRPPVLSARRFTHAHENNLSGPSVEPAGGNRTERRSTVPKIMSAKELGPSREIVPVDHREPRDAPPRNSTPPTTTGQPVPPASPDRNDHPGGSKRAEGRSTGAVANQTAPGPSARRGVRTLDASILATLVPLGE